MKTLRFWPAIIGLCYLLIAGAAGGPAAADESIHDRVGKSVVYLKVTGTLLDATGNKEEKTVLGTGFLVSPTGLVLTTYHLIESFGKNLIASSVTISGSVGAKLPDGQLAPMSIIDASIPLDLLLLRLKTEKEMVPVVIEDAEKHGKTQLKEIFTQGFPKDAQVKPNSATGHITVSEGPGGNTWTMDITVDEGASGSPIYVDTGSVIGLAKGDNNGNLGYFIPIEFASSMIAHVKLQEMAERLDDYNELRRRVTWNGKALPQGRDSFLFQIGYRKWVRGEPHVRKATFTVTPYFQKHQSDGDAPAHPVVQQSDLDPFRDLAPVPAQNGLEGDFELTALWDRLNKLRDGYSGNPSNIYIRRIVLTIEATLTDDTQLPPEQVTIEIEKQRAGS